MWVNLDVLAVGEPRPAYPKLQTYRCTRQLTLWANKRQYWRERTAPTAAAVGPIIPSWREQLSRVGDSGEEGDRVDLDLRV